MTVAVQALAVVAGVGLNLVVFYDLFQSVVLPRPAVNKVQLARLVVRPLWVAWRWAARRSSHVERVEAGLAAFGPLSLGVLFVLWALALVFGYALIGFGLAGEFHPRIADFPEAFYVSATTLMPLSYGDIVPVSGPARAMIVLESATGVAVAALAITLLFALYGDFRSREETIVALDALAGAPPSGVHLLETSAEPGMPRLESTFDEWRKWAAMVLESHLAYPLLIYFRSSHDNEAWVNSLAAVMDAAALVVSSLETEVEGSARLMLTMGNHLVEDLSWVFRLKLAHDSIVERGEYDIALERLRVAGYRTRDGDAGWSRFIELRQGYASLLNQMAHFLALPPAEWVGDRSYLPHRRGRRRRRGAR